jgi:hypothetical protein
MKKIIIFLREKNYSIKNQQYNKIISVLFFKMRKNQKPYFFVRTDFFLLYLRKCPFRV